MSLHVHWKTIEDDLKQVMQMQKPFSLLKQMANEKKYKSTWDILSGCACGGVLLFRAHFIVKNGAIISHHPDSESIVCPECRQARSRSQLQYKGTVSHVSTREQAEA